MSRDRGSGQVHSPEPQRRGDLQERRLPSLVGATLGGEAAVGLEKALHVPCRPEQPDTELVGEATDGEEAVARALELRPDVILMDLNMPDVNGIEATRRILEASPDTAILMLTMFDDDKSILAAMRAGAHGYVLKGADGAETLRAIHAVANGEAIFSPTITQRLSGFFATPGGDPEASPSQVFPNLTGREHEILSLIAEGYTNGAIALACTSAPKRCETMSRVSSPSWGWRIAPRQ